MILLLCVCILLLVLIFWMRLPEKASVIIERDDFECYVINLDKNKERLQSVQDSYDASDLKMKPMMRFRAVDGKEIDVQPFVTDAMYQGVLDLDKKGKRTDCMQLSRGAIGCYLSHVGIYEAVLRSDKEYALILEDDAVIDPHVYSENIRHILTTYPSDWDVILLGGQGLEEDRKDVTVRKFWGTWGYFIRRSGIEKFFQNTSYPITNAIDSVLETLGLDKKIHIYAPLTRPITLDAEMGTDIQISCL